MTWISRAVMLVAAASALVTAAVHIATFGPPQWASWSSAVWPWLFPGIFLVYGYVVIAINVARMPLEVLIGELPLWMKVGGGIVLVYSVVNFALMFRALQGAHDQDPIFVARLFTGHTLFFYTASAALAYQIERVRRGALNVSRGPRDDALEQDPLPGPLSRSLVLQTELPREECAARLAAWRGLRGEASPEVFRFDLARGQRSMVYAVGRFEGESPTFIRLLLTFKRFYLIVIGSTVLLLPVVALMFGPVGFAWQGMLFLLVFAGGGNIVYGLVQMRRLESQIRQATESQPASIG